MSGLESGYGRNLPKKGRPLNAETKARLAEPRREKCRRLQVGPKGGVSCGAMHGVMHADGCPDYKDASVDRGYVTAGPAWRIGLG